VAVLESLIVESAVLDPGVRLRGQPFHVVEQGRELHGEIRVAMEPQRPLPGVQGMVPVGTDEGLREVVQSPVGGQGPVEQRAPGGCVAPVHVALAPGEDLRRRPRQTLGVAGEDEGEEAGLRQEVHPEIEVVEVEGRGIPIGDREA
jgi:hypothetical protein